MKQHSTHWKASILPRKQRNYVAYAPDHIKNKFLGAHLSKPLREKHHTRSMRVREGDKVKILRGQFKGKEGKVESVNVAKTKVIITGIEVIKKDGSKARYPIAPSNLVITELNMADRRRFKKSDKKKESSKQETK